MALLAENTQTIFFQNHSADVTVAPNCEVNESSMTSPQNTTDWDYVVAAQYLRNVCVPTIVVVGLIGNTLSLMAFCSHRMRRLPSSMFLASLAIVDNLFLVSLMMTWIDKVAFPILTYTFACQCVVFLTYVTSFLSVWFIVSFTLERFFAICFPLKLYIRSTHRQKMGVFVLSIIACSIYHFSFWTVTIDQHDSRPHCTFSDGNFRFLEVATWIDTIITMVVPFVTIILVNIKVINKVSTYTKRRQHKHLSIHRLCRSTITGLRQTSTPIHVTSGNYKSRVTTVLIAVSTTFLALNLPSHAVRLYTLFMFSSSGDTTNVISLKLYFIQELSLMLYYVTFCCNVFLYSLFGRNFKESLKHLLLFRRSTDNKYRRQVLVRLNSTKGTFIANSRL